MKKGDLVRIKKLPYDPDLEIGQTGLIIKELGEFDGQEWFSVLINARTIALYEGKMEVVDEEG
jgi:hypothetical protein